MKILQNNDQRSAVFWLISGLLIALGSSKYDMGSFSSPGPGFLPLTVGLIMAALAFLVFQQSLVSERETLKGLWTQKSWRIVIKVMAALVLYGVLFKFLGFLLGTFFLLVYLLRVTEPMDWKKVVVWSVAFALGSYIVFHIWLEAQLPKGILGF